MPLEKNWQEWKMIMQPIFILELFSTTLFKLDLQKQIFSEYALLLF